MACGRLRGHPHLAEPFDHAPTDTSWEQRSQWRTMVRSKQLSVLLEGQHDIAFPVQSPSNVDRRSIDTPISLWQFTLWPFEVYKAMLLADFCDAESSQNVTKPHTCPHSVADGCAAPIEADCLLGHVLLLSAISSTNEGHWDAHLWSKFPGHEFCHAHFEVSCWDTRDLQSMSVEVNLRHCTMVADHCEGGRRDPTSRLQCRQLSLRIEWMAARQTNHVLVAFDPLVRSISILRIHFSSVLPWRHGQVIILNLGGDVDLPIHNFSIAHWLFELHKDWSHGRYLCTRQCKYLCKSLCNV
mmetsp:Transcript_11590/g.20025  ORF Transcript_11590/g.20025 Transcript_11590/m.20025 type:complete len:298 (-) Transcript_11590:132-1025(-)